MYNFIDTHIDIYKNLKLTPNMITTISLIIGLISALMILQKQYKTASILFFIQYYFDCVDGKVARKYNMHSEIGGYYDRFSDIFKYILIFYVLYKDNFLKFKKVIIIFVFVLIIFYMFNNCQKSIYNEDFDNGNFSQFYLKVNKESCNKLRNKLNLFSGTTTTLVLCMLIFFWKDL